MLSSVSVISFGLVYISLLFIIAYWGDAQAEKQRSLPRENLIYSLSLAVYCSSWTFYGAVGTAASTGFDYLAIYLGPCLVFLFGYPMIRRIILICKSSNITSVSDFIASRFGKSRKIAILVTTIAVVGSIPYIALQLKAISMSYTVLTSGQMENLTNTASLLNDSGFYVMLILALFTILFGTRHLDATEHHQGLILAVAFESIVKLFAILAVGYYTVFLLLDSSNFSGGELAQQSVSKLLEDDSSSWQSFLTKTLLAMSAIILLPRQFHVTIVEARDHHQFNTATWVMPIYLILTSIIVVPIAITGLLLMPDAPEDLYVLSLPLFNGNESLAMLAFIGGASAATGMVIVAAISLSTMISNDLVMPALLRWKQYDLLNRKDLSYQILLIRRVAIIALLFAAYGYYRLLDINENLANIGLLAFAAIAQLLPAMLSALFWKKAHSKGVFWGLVAGVCLWAYCLMMPTLLSESLINKIFPEGVWIHPQALFGITFSDALTHGVFWSLLANIILLIYHSMRSEQGLIEKVQASFYVNPKPTANLPRVSQFDTQSMSAIELKQAMNLNEYPRVPVTIDAIRAVADRIIGAKNTEVLLRRFVDRNKEHDLGDDTVVDTRLLSQVQMAIAGVIGASSAQKIMTERLLGGQQFIETSPLVEETSDVLKFNRNLMQTTLENISHGISVVDQDLNLVIWNSRYLQLFDYPENYVYSGMPVKDLLEFNANRGEFGKENKKSAVKKRLQHLIKREAYEHVSTRKSGRIIKHTGEPMSGGGYVTTYQDITDMVLSAQMLQEANEELEARVKSRTRELEVLTEKLEAATMSKTRFLAAASHDLLQPINAARLFSHTIRQRKNDENQVEQLVGNLEHSLNNANELLTALLDISKLDGEGIQAEPGQFSLQELLEGVRIEFEARAEFKKIEIDLVATSCILETDRRLLFSVLQNFLSNAVRYTPMKGRILIGVRRRLIGRKTYAEIQVLDNGIGIEQDKLTDIGQEFYQIRNNNEDGASPRGLGLGLSIVQRIASLLKAKLRFESEFGKGSLFSIMLPAHYGFLDSRFHDSSVRGSGGHESLQGLCVLCLDNNDSVLQSLVNVLEDWGCEVLSANTYQQAEEFMSADVDAILADYHLDGELTGLDFLKQYATLKPGLRSVLITAAQDSTLLEKAEASGFAYLRKPIDIQRLNDLLCNK